MDFQVWHTSALTKLLNYLYGVNINNKRADTGLKITYGYK